MGNGMGRYRLSSTTMDEQCTELWLLSAASARALA